MEIECSNSKLDKLSNKMRKIDIERLIINCYANNVGDDGLMNAF